MLTNGERASGETGDPKGSSHQLATEKCHGLIPFSFMLLETAIFIDRQNKADETSPTL